MFREACFIARFTVECTSRAKHGSGLKITDNGLNGVDSLVTGLGANSTSLNGRDDVGHLNTRCVCVTVLVISVGHWYRHQFLQILVEK